MEQLREAGRVAVIDAAAPHERVRSEAARLALGAIVDHNAAVMRPKR